MNGTLPNGYQHQQEYPNIQQTPPSGFETKPVNFNDSHDDFFQAGDDGRPKAQTQNDRSSVLTGWTSGITVPYSEHVDEKGQTQAQAIASEYSAQGSRLSNYPPVPEIPAHLQNLAPGDRKSTGFDSTGLSYIDENFRYYSSARSTPSNPRASSPTDAHDAPLVANMAGDGRTSQRRDLEYADPYNNAPQGNGRNNIFSKWIDRDRDPIEQRIERRRRGIGRQPRPFVVWFLTLVMVIVLIYEIVANYKATGAPFAFKPTVNPMIGPASIELVTLGARFPPCMKLIPDVPLTLPINCANATSTTPSANQLCSLESICAFGGFKGKAPNQWFRFIIPVFLHAGIIHLVLNMLGQWVLSGEVERNMGSAGFTILYFASGIFGNVLGGNFALVGTPSVGASGAIVGTLAVLWVDLLAHWQIEYKPVHKLIGHIINLIFVVGLGYVPGVDNFSHLGGFLMGLICGIILLPIISTTKRHKMIVWGLRLAMIPVAIILFVVLIRNFYTSDPSKACSWCRYLSCIPTASNNHCKGTGLTTTTTTN